MHVGFLHPGAMGAAMAACCEADTWWVGEGRSNETRARAEQAGLSEAASIEALVERCDVIVSICPPAAALDVATQMAGLGFGGIYVDANAVSPSVGREVAAKFERTVDGSVVGLPPTRPDSTRLFLSGPEAEVVASLWAGGLLEPIVLGAEPGQASALKMAYATWTKVRAALLLDVCALAEAEGVAGALAAEWERSQPGTAQLAAGAAAGVSPKAWRFVGEMEQMVATFDDAGLPSGFPAGAAQLYERLAGFKGHTDVTLADALQAIIEGR